MLSYTKQVVGVGRLGTTSTLRLVSDRGQATIDGLECMVCVSAQVKRAQDHLEYQLEYESRIGSSKHDDFRSMRTVLRRRPLIDSEGGTGGVVWCGVVCPYRLNAWRTHGKEFIYFRC